MNVMNQESKVTTRKVKSFSLRKLVKGVSSGNQEDLERLKSLLKNPKYKHQFMRIIQRRFKNKNQPSQTPSPDDVMDAFKSKSHNSNSMSVTHSKTLQQVPHVINSKNEYTPHNKCEGCGGPAIPGESYCYACQ